MAISDKISAIQNLVTRLRTHAATLGLNPTASAGLNEVTGLFENIQGTEAFDTTLTPSMTQKEISPSFIKGISYVRVDAETKTATTISSKTATLITPSEGKFLVGVEIPAGVLTPANSIDAEVADVISGKKAVVATGDADNPYAIATGTMFENGDLSQKISTNNTTLNIPAGHIDASAIEFAIDVTTLDNTILSGATVQTTAGDYDYEITLNLPAGMHNAQTIKKVIPEIFPAPESPVAASQMVAGFQAFDKDGKVITGTMPSQTSDVTFDALTQSSITLTEGYYPGTTKVNLTADLENALATIIGN